MGKSDDFFEEQTLQSRIKTEIVTKYFSVWSIVMAGHFKRFGMKKKIAYVDLFSGPGIYADGKKSTPILILEKAIETDYLKKNLLTIFLDSNPQHISALSDAISSITNINRLNIEPIVRKYTVGDELVERLESSDKVPSLFFIDPWGYKGLSSRLINAVIKDWGCDCIFLFNYNSINRWLNNPNVNHHIGALFGDDRLKRLQALPKNMQSQEREEKIMHELKLALYENNCKYVLQFCFKKDSGERTSHYIVFVTKDIKGYNIMKEIMAKISSYDLTGEPTFECNPVWEEGIFKFLEIDSKTPSRKLQELLLNDFAEKTASLGEIIDKQEHHVKTPYIKKHYKYALRDLWKKNIIEVDRKLRGIFPDNVLITFPPKKG